MFLGKLFYLDSESWFCLEIGFVMLQLLIEKTLLLSKGQTVWKSKRRENKINLVKVQSKAETKFIEGIVASDLLQ